MRRITVFLVPLLVLLLQTTAIAGMHWCPTCPPPQMATYGIFAVLIAMLLLAWLIMAFIKPGSMWCALFVAVGSISFTVLVWEPILALAYDSALIQGTQAIAFGIFSIVVLVGMLIWSGPCCLGKSINWFDAFKTTIIPVLFLTIIAGFF